MCTFHSNNHTLNNKVMSEHLPGVLTNTPHTKEACQAIPDQELNPEPGK